MIALVAAVALAADPSSLGFAQDGMAGLGASYATGERLPTHGGGTFDAPQVFLQLRWDTLAGRTARGAQYGLAHDVRLGWYHPQQLDPEGAVALPVGGRWREEVAVRFATFSAPTMGAVSLHAGGQMALFGGAWWSRTALHVDLVGGVRTTLQLTDAARVELDWTAIPIALEPVLAREGEAAPRVRHVEHWGRLTVGFGSFGVGAEATLGLDALDDERARSFTAGALFEWRHTTAGG